MTRRSAEGRSRTRIVAVADQAVASVSNVAITVIAARTLAPQAFGRFALAVTFCIVAIGVGRALATEPLLLKGRRLAGELLGDATGAMTALGVVAGVGGAAAAIVAGGPGGTTLLILSVFLPLLFMQDAWRLAAFAMEEPGGAFFVDVVWLAVQAVGTVALIVAHAGDANSFIAVWSGAGALAGLVGALRFRSWPKLPSAVRWVQANLSYGGPFLIEFATSTGGSYTVLAILAVTSGLPAVGAVRVAQTVFGPVNIAYQGVMFTLIPEGARHREDDIGQLRRPMVQASLALGGIAVLWTAAVLFVPSSVGRTFFGATWAGARRVLLLLGVAYCAGGLVTGAVAGLRALGAAWSLLQARLATLPVVLALPPAGALVADEVGFTAGMALAAWMTLGWWWFAFGKALDSAVAGSRPDRALVTDIPLIAGE